MWLLIGGYQPLNSDISILHPVNLTKIITTSDFMISYDEKLNFKHSCVSHTHLYLVTGKIHMLLSARSKVRVIFVCIIP